ncbi:MAG: glutamate 5-kinase [Candidatus Omnitrophica bacterium]|nr:glutamate 5-kinase [Candidatus Omnitrophota bacterium]
MKESGRSYKKIVVKIGSSFLCSEGKGLDAAKIDNIASQVAWLFKNNTRVLLVSSGAIAVGMSILKLNSRPKDLSSLQATASVGQHFLMSEYNRVFHKLGFECGQVLLTWEDFNERGRYLNAKNTLSRLLQLGVVPIINENDTVSTSEIKFGDNDRLSALVSSLVSAEFLIILSDVDGLLDREKKVIPVVDNITPEIKALACPSTRKTCVGGMITKIEAARIAVDSGIPCVIANGGKKDIIRLAMEAPEHNGTLFLPKKAMDARQRWIAFGTKPKGTIMVDEGAKKALLNNKSLLSVGINAVKGDFDEGEVISISDSLGNEFARGKICLSSGKLEKIKGVRYHKEIIHCDNIVIL